MATSIYQVPADAWDRIFDKPKRAAKSPANRLSREAAKATVKARAAHASSQGVTVYGRDLVAAMRSALAACGQSDSTVGQYRTDRIRIVVYRSGATFEGLDGPSLASADVGDTSGPAQSTFLISRTDAERLVTFTPDRKASCVTFDACDGLRLRRNAASIVAASVVESFPDTAAIMDTGKADGRYITTAGTLRSALRQAVACSDRPGYTIMIGGSADGLKITSASADRRAEATITVPGSGYGNEITPTTFNGRRLAELVSRFGRQDSVVVHLLDSSHRHRPIIVAGDGKRIALAELA